MITAKTLILSNARIVDVQYGKIMMPSDIHISDGIITSINPASNMLDFEQDNTQHIDCRGNFVIPGLIDSHVHILEEANEVKAAHFAFDEPDEIAFARANSNIEEALKAGITTVRDVGAYKARNNALRDLIESQVYKYKFRIVSCGNHITRENGHCFHTGRLWTGKKSLSDHVKEEILMGADFIKIMNDDIIFNLEELTELVNVAHELGKKVACHAITPQAIELAVRANADTIEHGYMYSTDILEEAISKNISISPTFVAAYDTLFGATDIQVVLDAFPDCSLDEFETWYRALVKYTPQAFMSGINVVAGTDAGTIPTPFNSLHRELFSYLNFGATNVQALQTATVNAAFAMGLDHIIGTIDVNKSADLVVLGLNPLESLKDSLSNILGVISRGYVVKTF